MSIEPFNAAAHEYLLSIGYKHERIEENWYDDGDAESGPHLAGHPSYDEYTDADSEVFISETDSSFQWRDLEAEAYWDQRYMETEQYE